jgi:hypothetical protein
MAYSLTLPCGCLVHVLCDPQTGLAHVRTIERRGSACRRFGHESGSRVYLWDLLPDPDDCVEPPLPVADPRSGVVRAYRRTA